MMDSYNNSMAFLNYPVFVINLKSKKENWEKCAEKLKNYGFTHVIRFDAIDPTNEKLIDELWNDFGNPILKDSHTYTEQANTLNHLLCYKMIIYNNIEYACIMNEWTDDIEFHKNWYQITPIYWKYTPKNFDLCVIGCDHSQCIESHESNNIAIQINNSIIFGLHFYIVSTKGVEKLLELLSKQPCDSLLNSLNDYIQNCSNKLDLNWIVWNARFFSNSTNNNNGLLFSRIH